MIVSQATPVVEAFVGFRRRFRICPQANSITVAVEDDFHCMNLVVEHDGVQATAVKAELIRAPWTTCPGAVAKIEDAFSGVKLADFARRGDKRQNCTHLYDLAILAAAHVEDSEDSEYDIFVADAVKGIRTAGVWRNGECLLRWTESDLSIVEPEEIAGKGLFDLNDWIKSLQPKQREAAKLLRWANLIANGRDIPIEEQSDAKKMPPNCYTFQPQRAVEASRIGRIRDFSHAIATPLDGG